MVYAADFTYEWHNSGSQLNWNCWELVLLHNMEGFLESWEYRVYARLLTCNGSKAKNYFNSLSCFSYVIPSC